MIRTSGRPPSRVACVEGVDEAARSKIDVELAKRFEADHSDVYRGKVWPGGRTLCGHFDLDPDVSGQGHAVPFNCSGTVDAKVVDAAMARRMSFAARSGSACGMPFSAGKFLGTIPSLSGCRDTERPAERALESVSGGRVTLPAGVMRSCRG